MAAKLLEPKRAQAAPPPGLPGPPLPLPLPYRQPGDLTYTPPPVIYPSPFVTRATITIPAPTEQDAVFAFKELGYGEFLGIFEISPYNWEITYAPKLGPV